MAEPQKHDFRILYGEYFETKVNLYNDPRVKRWRGAYNEHYLYKKGDGAYNEEGEAFVCTLETEQVEPGGFSSSFDWGRIAPLNLVGYTIKWHCGTVFVQTIVLSEPHALEGFIPIEIVPTQFASAQSQEHYFLEIKSPGGKPVIPIAGAMFFKNP